MNLFIISAVILTLLAVGMVITPLLRRTDEGQRSPVAASIVALALPAGALAMYLYVGNPDWSAPATGAMPGEIATLADDLEARLRTEPGDAEGWLLLGRTYAQLQRVADSRRAFRQALALTSSVEAKLGVAEADILLDRDNLARDAGRLVEEVLAVDPDNPKGLFYGGMVAMVRNDVPTFRDRWQRLLAMSPPEHIRAVIEAQLAMTDSDSGPAAAAESAPASISSAATSAADSAATGIDVNVSVAEALSGRIGPDAVIYLVARDPGRPGPPVAVVRQAADTLPLQLTLTDENAMLPDRLLSSLERVQLIARVSNSGEPTAQPGDLYGEAGWPAPDHDTGGISIVIDRLVE